jgi:hypothetical protein
MKNKLVKLFNQLLEQERLKLDQLYKKIIDDC